MNWKFFSERRRISLETFLAGVASYEDAVAYFSKKGISLPENDQLKKFWATKKKAAKATKPAAITPVPVKPVSKPVVDVSPSAKDEDPKAKNVKSSRKKASSRAKSHGHDKK
jgi:hypothetical protein